MYTYGFSLQFLDINIWHKQKFGKKIACSADAKSA